MKILKKIVTLSLVALLSTSTVFGSFAASTATYKQVSAEITDDYTKELLRFIDTDGVPATIEKIVTSTGLVTIKFTKNGVEKITTASMLNSEFTQYQRMIQGNYRNVRVNVHDSSIFNHDQISTIVGKKADLYDIDLAAGAIATAILAYSPSNTVKAAALAADTYINWVHNNREVRYVSVTERVFEVTFKADGIFYTWCHEDIAYGYKTSSGSAVATQKQTYESSNP